MGATLATMGSIRAGARPVATAPSRYKLDLLRLCLYLLIVMAISRIHQRYGFVAVLRPGLLCTALAMLVAFVKPQLLAERDWMARWPARVVAGLTVWALGSIAFGISQGGAFWYFSNYYWKVLVVGILLMAAIRNTRDLNLFVWAHVVGSGILAFMALFVFKMVAENNGITRLSNLDTWDANDVCVLMLIGLPLCLLATHTSSGLKRIAAAVVALGIGAVIARSGSRGGFLGLVCLLVAYIVSMKGTARIRGFGIVGALVVALLVAAPAGYWNQMKTITSAKDDYNWSAVQGRRQLAIRGVGYMMRYPIFGLGTSNFSRAEGTISPYAGMQGIRWSAPHNSYVEAGLELGVPGLLMFLTMIVGCIVVPWRMRKQIPASWQHGTWEERFLFNGVIYIPLSAVGFAVPAYFVSFAYLDPIYALTALTGGLIACVERKRRTDAVAVVARGAGARPTSPVKDPSPRRARPIRWAPVAGSESRE